MSRNLTVAGVLFDFYNTLVSIETDEADDGVWVRLARFVRYHGLDADPDAMRRDFFASAEERQRATSEAYPETDVVDIFRCLLTAQAERRSLDVTQVEIDK